ncbi:MAG: TolC family protein [Phycisphaerales bacterium]|nr:TolC family protein [Phycisphaerales bacterium]
MYREMLAVDLGTVARVATARSIDIRQARERVEAARGRYESSVEAVLPVIAPALTYQHLEGANQNANGSLAFTNFNNLLPAITLQWIVNPGRIYYDIVASKRRLEASGQQEQAAELDAVRAAAVQYYDLMLAQARVAVARRAAAEAEEALRLTNLRAKAGAGLPADEMRARAFLAGRRQDLLLAVNAFYQASVALTVTLHLDPVVTLVPSPTQLAQVTLVREDLDIDHLLGMAVQYRPDLKAARILLAAAEADKGAVVWGALGPQLQAAYTYGGLGTRGRFQTAGIHEQQRASPSAGFALGLSTFGNVKTAGATLRSAALDAERQLEEVRAGVVAAQQASLTNAALVPFATEQVQSAEEALRLAQANLKEGTLLLLDVLQAEDQLDAARLRYADAVAHYNQSQVNLMAALGLLEAQRLTPESPPPATTPAPGP